MTQALHSNSTADKEKDTITTQHHPQYKETREEEDGTIEYPFHGVGICPLVVVEWMLLPVN